MKRNQHSLIDSVFQRNFIWHIIIADFIYIFAVHSLRRCRQSKEKLRSEIFYNSSILVVDCMMKFINHHVIEVIRSKIFFIQIFRFPKACYRGKYKRFICAFLSSHKKSIVFGISYVLKRNCGLFQNLFPMCNKQHFLIFF